MPPAVRRLLAAALVSTVLGAAGPAVADPGAGAAVDTPAALVAAQARLAAADAAIAAVAVQLADGTVRWQAGVDALGDAQGAALRAEDEALRATADADRDQRLLWAMVASDYRNPPPSPGMLLLHGGAADVTASLHASVGLQRVRDAQQAALRAARDSRSAAAAAAEQARSLRDADAARERELATELAALQDLASRTDTEVQAARTDVARLQAQRDREVADELARRAAEVARQGGPAADRSGVAGPPSAGPPSAGQVAAGDCPGRPTAGYANGDIALSALCPLHDAPGQVLRADAAAAFNRMTDAARAERGAPICVTDSYRDYATQVQLFRTKPSLAAVPGTSNHGWGVAVDLCGGVQDFGSPASAWLRANAGRFGWVHPGWAEPGGSRPEPWHWEYVG